MQEPLFTREISDRGGSALQEPLFTGEISDRGGRVGAPFHRGNKRQRGKSRSLFYRGNK